MKIKFKRKNIINLLILCFLLASIRFFYLVKLPTIFEGAISNVLLTSIVSVVAFFIYLFVNNLKIDMANFGWLITVFYIIVCINVVSMQFKYHYPIMYYIWSSVPYFIFLMYFPIRDYLVKDKGLVRFVKIYEVISIILSLLLILQQIIYMHKGIVFLNINESYILWFNKSKNLESFLVFYFEGFLRMAPILSGYKMIENNLKIKGNFIHFITFCLSFGSITLIGQTRAYILSLVVALGSMYLSRKNIKIDFRKLAIIIVVLIFAAIILYQNVGSVIATLQDPSDGSNYARVGAIKYYWEHLHEHPLTGYGFVVPDKSSSIYYEIKGSRGIYNFDDIGIMGVLGSMGLLGVGWYIAVWIRLLMLSRRCKYKTLCIGLTIMMLFCMLTLSYLDKARIIDMVLTLAIVDGLYLCSSKGEYYVFCNNNGL